MPALLVPAGLLLDLDAAGRGLLARLPESNLLLLRAFIAPESPV